jgi:hypothetical protein
MKLATVFAAATILAGSAASAQLAFITQIGDDNTGVNISEQTRGNGGDLDRVVQEVQVIAQVGNNLDAANVSRGRDNLAYNYQFAGSDGGFATSLIYQDGPDRRGGDGNTAVTVQNNPGGGAILGSQTVQFGNNNTAINWTDSRGNALAGALAPAVEAPSLGVVGVTFNPPVDVNAVAFPFGDATVSVGGSIQQFVSP